MYYNIFVSLIFIFYFSTSCSQVQTRWMIQKRNNSDDLSTVWFNRYYINEEFAEPDGPLFIFVNSGSDLIDLQWLTHGIMYELAETHHALLLSLEPRFYGESRPTPDLSVENLQFLSHDQILFDLANFIRTFKIENTNHTESKVVLWGDAFGATYAVWMKLLFPNLIDGVWASNARIKSVYPGYSEYFDHFTAMLRSIGGEQCLQQLTNTLLDIDHLIQTHNAVTIKRDLNLCFPIETHNYLDIGLFVGFLTESIDKALRRSNNQFIENFCHMISNTGRLSNIAALGVWLQSELQQANCFTVSYQAIFPSLRSTSWFTITTQPAGLRQWYWQLCSEFATFRTTESPNQPFPNRLPASLFHEVCKHLFGDQFTEERINAGSTNVNERFGGLNPSVSNVYFTNSALNSYRFLAPLTDLSMDSPSDLYPDGQLTDLRSFASTDSIEVRRIKITVYGLVANWVGRN